MQLVLPMRLFDMPFGRYYIDYNFPGKIMDVFASFMKSWDFHTIGRWFLLPMAIVVALFLPPLLLSFILTFVLIVAVISLHPFSYALVGRALPGHRAGIRPRGPPLS